MSLSGRDYLTIPHARYAERSFVLAPLADLETTDAGLNSKSNLELGLEFNKTIRQLCLHFFPNPI